MHSSSFPQHFCNLEWIDQMVGKKLTESRKAKFNQTKSAFQTNYLTHIVSDNNSQQSFAGSPMGLNEVDKVKILTTLTKGWPWQWLFNLDYKPARALLKDSLTVNYENYNFLDCDWFEKLIFSTNSLAKLLSDSLLSDSSISQSRSKL